MHDDRVQGTVGPGGGDEAVQVLQQVLVAFPDREGDIKSFLADEGLADLQLLADGRGHGHLVRDKNVGKPLADGLDAVHFGIHAHEGDILASGVFAVVITAGRRADDKAGKVGFRLGDRTDVFALRTGMQHS